MCSIHITSDIEELNKLFNPNYHLLVTYGDSYDEYHNEIAHRLPQRFSGRWFHKTDITDIHEFNHNVNYCYITNVIERREKTRPIFSIFTTCFKSYDYIDTAYESIKKQSLIDWEWVIMDDTPEDEHFTFLKGKLSGDNRIRLYKRDKNSGNIGNVKNEAISLCRGKYVLEMDHDDEILTDCLQDAYNIFQTDEQIGFIYGDTIHLYRDGTNFKYSDFICKGYGGYYMEKVKGNWVYVYNTPNINNITLSHLVCLPNHPRIWKRSVLMELESYSEFLPICDDYEILLRTCCSKYKVVKNNKAQYIQYMNDGGNNFSNIRNTEINRIGPNYIGPMFYEKYEVHSKMKELEAYEDESYIHNQSQIWKRGDNYDHKKMNERINTNYDKQYCILNDAIDNEEVVERLRELYKNERNDFLFLSNQLTNEELQQKLESLHFDRMKCYSYHDCTEEELINYFKMMYLNDNCDHEVINTNSIKERNPLKTRVFIIHNNRKGGVNKYINDIMNEYINNEYIFIENKEMLYENNYSAHDILFIQNLLYCNIKIDDIIRLYDKFHCKIIIAIHDFVWLCQDKHNYTNDIPSAYLNSNISVSSEVKQLLSLAEKVIMNSQFTYDVYSKHFDSSNFIMCYPNDYNVQPGIKNIPEIKNKCIHIGIFSPLSKFKGELYVQYLKDKFECDTITFQIVGQNIPYYEENEFYDYIRKYNINGFLLLNEWGETYGYLLTKIINSGLPLLYNNFGAVKERISGTQEHYFKVYDNEHYGEVIIDYTVLDSQFNKFVEYINMNHGTVEDMNEDFTIVTRPVYDELFLPVTDIYQKREIPKHVFQTSKETLPSYVKELINMYCPEWQYSHYTDKECIHFFRENPITEFPNIIEKFHSFTQGQHKADLFRYYYLYLRGGIFLDSDAMFETNINNIIQDYESVFAKSFMKNEHLFNGFIATYPRNEIIYNALKHAYNTENTMLHTNYHYLCEELLRIVLSEQKKASKQHMIIYQEYSDTVEGKSVGRFKNTREETVFIHYWQNREIPSNLLVQNDNREKWVFYYSSWFESKMVQQYIENLNSIYPKYYIYLTNNREDLLIDQPKKVTFVYEVFDSELINKLPNTEFSFLNTEPLNLKFRLDNIINTLNTYPMWKYYDYSKSNLKILKDNNIDMEHKLYLPYTCGKDELTTLINLNAQTNKEYDFGIICGSGSSKENNILHPRRKRVVDYITTPFKVNQITGWGNDRDSELAKCKVILNIHAEYNYESINIFEHIRCDRLLEAGFNILSETSYELDQDFVNKYPNLKQIEYNDFFNIDTINKVLPKSLNLKCIQNQPKIIDCFIFYNELDMLTYRLNILNNIVDYFVLVESMHTFVGKEKPLFYQENKHLFEKFNHKIIHIIVDDFPHKYHNISFEKKEQWNNEKFQRNCISRGIDKLELNNDDLIIIADVDEIPKIKLLENIKYNEMKINEVKALQMDFYYYNLHSKLDHYTDVVRMLPYNLYKNINMTIDDLRFKYQKNIINNAGWHLSYFGNEKFIKNKLENFSHQEFNKVEFTDEKLIEYRIKNGKDLFDRPTSIITIPIEDNDNLPPDYNVYLTNFYTDSIQNIKSSLHP